MHPAIPLSIEIVVGSVSLALGGLDAALVSLVSGMEGLLVGAMCLQFVIGLGHAVLAGLEVREVRRLRGEQLRKRASLKGGVGGVDEREGEGGLGGWVEMEDGMGEGRGAGGGLGGKGGGL